MGQVEKIVEQGLLYDFYGELLNRHQRELYESLVYDDMSLNEMAEAHRISKQAVHDLLRRCTAAMEGYEKKLHLIERFRAIKSAAEEIDNLADTDDLSQTDIEEIRRLSRLIIEEIS